MKRYFLSVSAGILVGMVYGLLDVQSPAPPVVALIGLAGILIGEQLPQLGKQIFAGSAFPAAWRRAKCGSHIFGDLPGRQARGSTTHPDKQNTS